MSIIVLSVPRDMFCDILRKRAANTMYNYTCVNLRAKCLLSDDFASGCAVYPDGEICHFFGAWTAVRFRMLEAAIANGGTHVRLFEGRISRVLQWLGFIERSRESFDTAMAPSGWSYEHDGAPDVLVLETPDKGTRK